MADKYRVRYTDNGSTPKILLAIRLKRHRGLSGSSNRVSLNCNDNRKVIIYGQNDASLLRPAARLVSMNSRLDTANSPMWFLFQY